MTMYKEIKAIEFNNTTPYTYNVLLAIKAEGVIDVDAIDLQEGIVVKLYQDETSSHARYRYYFHIYFSSCVLTIHPSNTYFTKLLEIVEQTPARLDITVRTPHSSFIKSYSVLEHKHKIYSVLFNCGDKEVDGNYLGTNKFIFSKNNATDSTSMMTIKEMPEDLMKVGDYNYTYYQKHMKDQIEFLFLPLELYVDG